MFERFTEGARRVVVLAQEESRILNHNYIGTEHLLLGILHEEKGLGAEALTGLGVSLARARAEVLAIIGQGTSSPSGHIPFTPRAKKVLELSLRESLQLSMNYVGPEHILLGLVREGEGVAAQVLVKLGTSLTAVRQAMLALLTDAPKHRLVGEPPVVGPHCPSCRSDLTATLASHLVTVVGDEEAADRTVAVLYCKGCGRAMGVLPQSASAAE